METIKSNFRVKVGIAFCFLILIAIVLIFEYCQVKGWTTELEYTEFTLIALLIIIFYFSLIKTGLWQFSHKSFSKLDERELLLINRSLRLGYAFFSVFVLLLLLFFSLLNLKISIVLAVAMILFAHLVPTAIIGFSEKQINYGQE
jgi:fatty acid desaturase